MLNNKRQHHIIDLPKKIVIGHGVRYKLPSLLKELGIGSRIVIVSGSDSTKAYAAEISDILSARRYDTWIEAVATPDVDSAKRVINTIKDIKPSAVLGVGGGKAIDIAKYSAFSSEVDFISIPTALSHDGIASPFASLKGLPTITSIETKTPVAILADLDIIAKAPKRLLIAGVGDLVAKFTSVLDWRLSHMLHNEYYAEYAASLAIHSAKHVLSSWEKIKSGNVEGIRIVLEGLISSGVAMCIAGSTRPASGSEHLFSHALDLIANYPALHGEQVGVGTIMMAYLHGKNWRYIRKVLKELDAPTTARDLGVSDKDIIKALVMAHKIRPERYTILGKDGLTWEAAENLARSSYVIE